MTISDFYNKHGIDGLRRLAAGTGTKLSYIRALLYSRDKNPSLKMAIDLVRASGNELTYEGLAYPKGEGAAIKIPAPTSALAAE